MNTGKKHHNQGRQTIYKWLAVLLSLVLMLGLWLLLKGWLLGSGVEFGGNYGEQSFVPDPVCGYRFQPCERFHSVKMLEGDTVYDVTYNIHCNGTRVSGAGQGNKHLLFFGCSFTFGEGLNDSQTLAWRMGELMPQYSTYNFGGSGYGPQQMLSILQTDHLDTVVTQTDGAAIYLLLPEHIHRAAGSPYVVYNWGSGMPYYELKGDSLVRFSSFQQGRRWSTYWYKALGKLGLLNMEALAYPKLTEEDINLTVAIISKARQEYENRYPQGQFRVLCYPSAVYEQEYTQLIEGLQMAGVELLDYRELFPIDDEHTIINDGHPSAEAVNKVVAALSLDVKEW